MHALDVVTVPAAEGKQLTCFGESETGSMTCHDGNGHTYSGAWQARRLNTRVRIIELLTGCQ